MIEFFKIVTAFGGIWIVSTVVTFTIIILLIHHKWRPTLFLMFVVLATEISAFLMKQAVALPRPPDALHLITVSGFGFPSAHAAVAVALYGSLWYLLSLNLSRISTKLISTVSVVLVIVLIAESRLVLGVHSIPDVIAGSALGAIWLAIGILLFKRILPSTRP